MLNPVFANWLYQSYFFFLLSIIFSRVLGYDKMRSDFRPALWIRSVDRTYVTRDVNQRSKKKNIEFEYFSNCSKSKSYLNSCLRRLYLSSILIRFRNFRYNVNVSTNNKWFNVSCRVKLIGFRNPPPPRLPQHIVPGLMQWPAPARRDVTIIKYFWVSQNRWTIPQAVQQRAVRHYAQTH